MAASNDTYTVHLSQEELNSCMVGLEALSELTSLSLDDEEFSEQSMNRFEEWEDDLLGSWVHYKPTMKKTNPLELWKRFTTLRLKLIKIATNNALQGDKNSEVMP